MKLNGKTKSIGIGVAAAVVAAMLSGFTVHMRYRESVKGEGEFHGATAAQLTSLDRRMDRHVNMCDNRMTSVVRELGEIRGTVDAIWRHLERTNGAQR